MEDIKKAVSVCFSKYGDFSGRAARPEFWWFMLALFVVSIVLNIVFIPLAWIFSLATIVPSLSAGARRLHDTGKTGWLQLLWIIPVLGWAVIIYMLAQPGDAAANRFGPAPADAPAGAEMAPGQQ